MAGRRRRLPTQHGPQLTDRDVEILGWIGRHGVVTPVQVARHFFSRNDGAVGLWAAYRRLRKLEEIGVVRQDRTFWRESNVLRLTGAGARLADVGVGPARLVLAEIRHTLAVVDLTEALLASGPPGTTLITERELRIGRRRDLADGARKVGRGRVPDAVLVEPTDTQVAVELDITPKRSRDLDGILVAYLQERYSRILWYVLPSQEERLKEIVRKQRADDFIEVRVWRPAPPPEKV